MDQPEQQLKQPVQAEMRAVSYDYNVWPKEDVD